MWENIDLKKIVVAFLAMAGTVFTLGAVFSDYRDLPHQVSTNTDGIHENREAIRNTSAKLDAVLCLLVQDQIAPEGAKLNPLLCLDPGVKSSFLPGSPALPGG